MIEHHGHETEAGTMFCSRLACEGCGEKFRRALDAYVLWYDWYADPEFIHKSCFPSDLAEGSGLLLEEATIFFHRLLHNMGEPVAAEELELIQECPIIGDDPRRRWRRCPVVPVPYNGRS